MLAVIAKQLLQLKNGKLCTHLKPSKTKSPNNSVVFLELFTSSLLVILIIVGHCCLLVLAVFWSLP